MIPKAIGPTEDSDDGTFARRIADALGSALQAKDGTAAAADLLALAGALADANQSRKDIADEMFVDSASDTLDQHERAYGLPVEPNLSNAARQARLTAKVRAARAATPAGIASALLALGAIAANTVPVHENTPGTVPAPTSPYYADDPTPPRAGDARLVFLFAVRLTVAAWNDTTLRARVDAILAQMRPAHTAHTLHTNDPALGFRCNDPDSLVGRDAVFTV